MNAVLRGAVPGQLCLLEFLERVDDPNDASDANDPHGAVGPDAEGARTGGELELGEWERTVLRFAAEHHLSGRYVERVEQHLGCSAARYLQTLTAMLDRPEVLVAEPELIGRLRALRDRRQRLRALTRAVP